MKKVILLTLVIGILLGVSYKLFQSYSLYQDKNTRYQNCLASNIKCEQMKNSQSNEGKIWACISCENRHPNIISIFAYTFLGLSTL